LGQAQLTVVKIKDDIHRPQDGVAERLETEDVRRRWNEQERADLGRTIIVEVRRVRSRVIDRHNEVAGGNGDVDTIREGYCQGRIVLSIVAGA